MQPKGNKLGSNIDLNNEAYLKMKNGLSKFKGKYVVFANGKFIGAFTSIFLVGFTVVTLNNAFTKEEVITDPQFKMPESAIFEKTEVREGVSYKVFGVHGSGDKYLVREDNPSQIIKQESGVGSSKLPAPQARLMATVIDGVLNRRLPWVLILMGISLTIGVELCGVRALAFAVGVYLPLSTTMPIFIGGAIKWAIDKFARREEEEAGPGMLFSSGLIAGGAIGGLLFAILTGFELDEKLGIGPRLLGNLAHSNWFGLLVFAILCSLLVKSALSKKSA